jgi:hypothetical protein
MYESEKGNGSTSVSIKKPCRELSRWLSCHVHRQGKKVATSESTTEKERLRSSCCSGRSSKSAALASRTRDGAGGGTAPMQCAFHPNHWPALRGIATCRKLPFYQFCTMRMSDRGELRLRCHHIRPTQSSSQHRLPISPGVPSSFDLPGLETIQRPPPSANPNPTSAAVSVERCFDWNRFGPSARCEFRWRLSCAIAVIPAPRRVVQRRATQVVSFERAGRSGPVMPRQNSP